MICQGHLHGVLKLDLKMDVSTVQLVGPQTSREEFKSLYYEVYKLQRLLGSPCREPRLVAEVVSSLEDCQGWERGKTPQMMGEPNPTDIQPPRSRTLGGGGGDASVERSLAEVREAHQKALAMAATLREEIEWLSCLSSGASQKHKPISKAGTTTDVDPGDRRGSNARYSWRTAMPPTLSTTLPRGVQNQRRCRGY